MSKVIIEMKLLNRIGLEGVRLLDIEFLNWYENNLKI